MTYWAAYTPDGHLFYWVVRQTRKAAVIALICELQCDPVLRRDMDWRKLYREGWRIKKVRIVPVEEP